MPASPRRRRLADDAAFAETHFLVVDFEATTPKGAAPEPTEVAVLGMQHLPGQGPVCSGFAFESLIKPPAHAPVTAFDQQLSGITPADVAGAEPAAVVLGTLDQALPPCPKLLVAHHAPVEAGFVYRYREACPRLAHTRLICTRLLARAVWPDLPSYTLDALLDHSRIPQPARRHRAMDDTTVTAALFRRLLTDAARHHTLTSLADLIRHAGLQPKAAAPAQLELS